MLTTFNPNNKEELNAFIKQAASKNDDTFLTAAIETMIAQTTDANQLYELKDNIVYFLEFHGLYNLSITYAKKWQALRWSMGFAASGNLFLVNKALKEDPSCRWHIINGYERNFRVVDNLFFLLSVTNDASLRSAITTAYEVDFPEGAPEIYKKAKDLRKKITPGLISNLNEKNKFEIIVALDEQGFPITQTSIDKILELQAEGLNTRQAFQYLKSATWLLKGLSVVKQSKLPQDIYHLIAMFMMNGTMEDTQQLKSVALLRLSKRVESARLFSQPQPEVIEDTTAVKHQVQNHN